MKKDKEAYKKFMIEKIIKENQLKKRKEIIKLIEDFFNFSVNMLYYALNGGFNIFIIIILGIAYYETNNTTFILISFIPLWMLIVGIKQYYSFMNKRIKK